MLEYEGYETPGRQGSGEDSGECLCSVCRKGMNYMGHNSIMRVRILIIFLLVQ